MGGLYNTSAAPTVLSRQFRLVTFETERVFWASEGITFEASFLDFGLWCR
jgi:hypothetical protein